MFPPISWASRSVGSTRDDRVSLAGPPPAGAPGRFFVFGSRSSATMSRGPALLSGRLKASLSAESIRAPGGAIKLMGSRIAVFVIGNLPM